MGNRKVNLPRIRQILESEDVWVFCDVSGKRRIGLIEWVNVNTCIVKIMKGARTFFTITRHYTKHNVQHFKMETKKYEDVYTPVEDSAYSTKLLALRSSL